jgi:hypothetical protein
MRKSLDSRGGEAPAFHVGMTWRNLRLDVRDFLAATPDSCRDSQPRRFDLFECPPVALQRGVSTAEVLPALDDDVAILRVDLQPVADPPVGLGRRQGCTAAEERTSFHA